MKRFFLLTVTFLYFAGSTGFAMHFHYCMEQLESASLVYAPDGDLEKCDMHEGTGDAESASAETGDNCCNDEVQKAKSNDSQLVSELSLKLIKLWSTSLPMSMHQYTSFVTVPTDVIANPTSHAPPNEIGVPLFLRNCVFRI